MTWAPDYATVQQLRDYMRIQDSIDDVQLAYAITAASRAVERSTNRQFGKDGSLTSRYYTARWDPSRTRWVFQVDDLMTTTGLTVAYDQNDDQTYSATITAYRLRPLNNAAAGRPWTELEVMSSSSVQPTDRDGAMKVTGTFGWTVVPDAIVQAVLIQASRFMIRRDSPYGVAGSSEMGGQLRLLARVDPDVEVALGPYRRWWGAR